MAGIYAVVHGRVARADGFHIWDEPLEAAGLSEVGDVEGRRRMG
jgi:hypothetical protein